MKFYVKMNTRLQHSSKIKAARERESKNNSLSKTILRMKKPNNYINLKLHNSKVLSLNFGYQTGN